MKDNIIQSFVVKDTLNPKVWETPNDIKKAKIKSEIKKGIIPDPNSIDPITGEPLPLPEGDSEMDPGINPAMGMDPEMGQQLQEPPAGPSSKDTKKAEI
jgi:hypothetical protein